MKSEISLRPAVEHDAEFLWDLHCAALKPYIAQTWGWDEAFQRRYFMEHFKPAHAQIVRYMGVDAGVITVEETRLGYILSNVELFPQYQGLGLGTALLRDLLDKAAERGLPVNLRVLKCNPARQLYLRLGFEVIGETETHYWMRREGHPRAFLPSRWETKRCFVIAADEALLPSVAQVLTENNEVLEMSGEVDPPQKLALDVVNHRRLPPNGVAWRDQSFIIRDLESRDTIGFLSVYFGYPTAETIFVGHLYLRPMAQRRGLGREIVIELERRAVEMGFRESRVAVGLKNWAGLRFWTSRGYSRITRLRIDGESAQNPKKNVELLKTLGKSES